MPRPETGSPRSLAGPSKIVEFEPPETDSNRQNYVQFKKTKRQTYFNSNFATTVSFDSPTQGEDGAGVFKGTNITVSAVGIF